MTIGRENLLINRNSLDNELIHQPDLYYQAGVAYAHANSEADAAKDEVKYLEAELGAVVRAQLEGKERVTEAMVTAGILTHPKMVKAKERLIRKVRAREEALALKESFQQRSYAIKDLCGLFIANYFTGDTVSGPSAQVREAGAQRQKEAIAALEEAEAKAAKKDKKKGRY